jgi:chitinase
MVVAGIAGILSAKPAAAAPWITAYLPGWEVSQNGVSPSGIDMQSVTHLVWFSLTPTSTGSIVESSNNPGINANAASVAAVAHNAGKKALICIGGAGTEPSFQAAFNAGNTSTLVNSIVNWVNQNGYDGVDIDDEPMQSGDSVQYQSFIKSLRSALPSGKVLTAAAEPFGAATSAFAGLTTTFDQINIMTYDMIYGNPLSDGSGELTWYNAPLSNGGNFEQSGAPMPSIAQAVTNFKNAGVPAGKLGIGAAFYGYIFPGATNIMQAYRGTWPPNALSYAQIMSNSAYYNSAYYHYDSNAGAAYIGRTDTGNFITYDDPTAVTAKVNYLDPNGLGGLVCFEIGQQYMGGQNPLLKAIDSALGSTTGGGTVSNGIHTLTPQCAPSTRLDDSGGGTTNGNRIQIWQAASTANQQWSFSNIRGNTYNIAVNLGPYCLDSNGGAAGTAVHLWSCGGYANQQWTVNSVSGGYELVNSAGNCLDDSNFGTANGNTVQSWTCGGNSAQTWMFDYTPPTIANGVHTLTPQCATGSRLDDSGGSTANGNKVQIWQAAGNANQQWNFSNIGGNTFNIAVNLGPYCLDANGGASGTAVHLWSCGGYDNQKWTAIAQQNGFQFQNPAGTCLDVAGAGTANGTVVQNYACNGNDTAQIWAVN